MNITFFIGNGFDLNLGLKTRYSDFYPFFINSSSENNMISKWISEDEQQWSDLEKKLGEELKRISKNDLEKFFDDKDEMVLLLSNYLSKQESLLTAEQINSIGDEFIRSIKDFGQMIPESYRLQIESIKMKYRNEPFRFQFVSFNYTGVLDRLVRYAKNKGSIAHHLSSTGTTVKESIDEVIHIHGTTKSDMVLGVNDINQIGNKELRLENNLQQSIIKEKMNHRNGSNKTAIVKRIIDESHIVCIFGMSIGDTDGLWWNILIEWLQNNDNRLIIYNYVGDPSRLNPLTGKKNRESSRIIQKVLGRRNMSPELYQTIESRVFVLFENDIFRFQTLDNQQ